MSKQLAENLLFSRRYGKYWCLAFVRADSDCIHGHILTHTDSGSDSVTVNVWRAQINTTVNGYINSRGKRLRFVSAI